MWPAARRTAADRAQTVRILMISDVYFPRVNGVSTSIQTFRRELISQGHEVTIVAPRYSATDKAGDDLMRVLSRRVPFDPEDRLMRRGELSRLEARLSGKTFDIVHVHTPFVAHYTGLRLAQAFGVPCVETYHTFFEEYLYNYIRFLPRRVLRAVARRLSRAQCNRVDAVLVPSNAMRDKLVSYGVVTPLHIAPTGIDLKTFIRGRGSDFRLRNNIPLDRPVLLYVGRVAHEKNLRFLLGVVAEVRCACADVLLIIAGEGPALDSLRQEVAHAGLSQNVMFVGYLSRQGPLQDCYRAADVFVFASSTETQGLVLLEAMALGVPVVSTAIMGTRDVLCDGLGCLIAQAEVADFAAKVVRVLRDSGLRGDLAKAAVRYSMRWSAAVLAEHLSVLYSGAVARYWQDHEGAQARADR